MGKTVNPSQPPLVRGGEQALPPDKGGSRGVKLFLPYNKILTELARENRKTPTPAEIRIWNEVLRKRQIASYKFLRQKPIASFIVDFYCAELRLVIEIDGHDHAEQAGYDLERTRVLDKLGLAVVRYGNDEVLGNIEGVYEDLVCRIQSLTPLNPPLSGGRACSPPLTRGGREGLGDRGGLKNDDDLPKADPTP